MVSYNLSTRKVDHNSALITAIHTLTSYSYFIPPVVLSTFCHLSSYQLFTQFCKTSHLCCPHCLINCLVQAHTYSHLLTPCLSKILRFLWRDSKYSVSLLITIILSFYLNQHSFHNITLLLTFLKGGHIFFYLTCIHERSPYSGSSLRNHSSTIPLNNLSTSGIPSMPKYHSHHSYLPRQIILFTTVLLIISVIPKWPWSQCHPIAFFIPYIL